jgi:CheY-like chemotaxis protein
MGFDVQCCLEANDGLEAVKIVEELLSTASNDKTGVDIILLDDQMPGLRGPEVVRRIRDLGFENPIIGVTGSNSSEDIDNFLASGADTVLHKPLEVSKLILFLRQIELK